MAPALPGRKRVGIYLTPEAHETLMAYCRAKNVSLTAWLEGIAEHVTVRQVSGDLQVETPEETAALELARQITRERRSRKPTGGAGQ